MNVNGARMPQFRIWYSHESCRARLKPFKVFKSLQDAMLIWPNLFVFRSQILYHVMLSYFLVVKYRGKTRSPGRQKSYRGTVTPRLPNRPNLWTSQSVDLWSIYQVSIWWIFIGCGQVCVPDKVVSVPDTVSWLKTSPLKGRAKIEQLPDKTDNIPDMIILILYHFENPRVRIFCPLSPVGYLGHKILPCLPMCPPMRSDLNKNIG